MKVSHVLASDGWLMLAAASGAGPWRIKAFATRENVNTLQAMALDSGNILHSLVSTEFSTPFTITSSTVFIDLL